MYRLGPALLAVWLLGTLVGFVHLARTDSLWIDELSSYWFSSGEDVSSVFRRMIARSDPHPPGYQILLHLWLRLAPGPVGVLGVRGSSLVAYGAALWAGALLVGRVSGSVRGAWIYALSYSCLSFVPYYATELRSYMSQQAALMLVLLAREHRCMRFTAGWALVEFVSTLYLATSHYVGSLVVGSLAATALIARGRGQLRASVQNTVLDASYFVGPVLSSLWLWFGPSRDGFRTLESPDAWGVMRYFVDAIGPIQLVVFFASGLLLVRTKRSPSEVSRLGERTGAAGVSMAFVGMVLLLPVQPVLQKRNVLLLIPPVLAFFCVLLGEVRTTRKSGLVAALAVPVLAVALLRDLRRESNSTLRAGSDYSSILRQSKSRRFVCPNQDSCEKLLDAHSLASPGSPLPLTYAPRLNLPDARVNLLGTLEPRGSVVLACPHCRAFAAIKDLEGQLGLACRSLKTAGGDRAWACRFESR